MTSSTLRKSGLAAAAASALCALGVPLALAAPTAVPPSDSQGYVDSTARCTKPDTAVLFGTTQTSRVAICKTAGGFEYRGVRISDGAKLIATATQTSGNTFTVKSDGVVYTVTPTALSVTSNGDTFRTETWSDFHSTQSPAEGSAAASATPTTSGAPTKSSSPATSAPASPATSASATPGLTTSTAAKPPATPTSAAPLPPPLAAEVGGSPSSGG